MIKFLRAHPAWTVIGLVALLFVFGVNIATTYTDWLWYREVGYPAVFRTIVGTRLLLFVVFGAASFALAYVNLRLAERFSPPLGIQLPGAGPDGGVFVIDREGRPRVATVNGRVVRTLSGLRRALAGALLAGALAFAVLCGLSASGEWDSFLRFRHGVRWGDADPLLGRDIGFYVFTLPFLRWTQGWLLAVLLIVTAAVAALYFFQRGIDTAAGRTYVAPHVRGHLSALIALALLAQAWGYSMDRFDLLYAGGKSFWGAGYTDVHARLPALNLLVGVAALAALAVLVNIRTRSIQLPLIALGLWLVAWVGAAVIYPGFVQATVVRPNEASRERPYIGRALAATRRAYGLENVTVRTSPAATDLTTADIARNQGTLRNIRLWDYEPLRETYPQQQGLRQYYAFPDVDVDRYPLGQTGAGSRQVWLAVREIAPERLVPGAQTWPNLHLRYTHGYGVVMSLAGEFTEEGLPRYLLKDIPTVSTLPDAPIALTEPRIYYGQEARRGSYVVVGTRQREFDRPGDETSGGGDRENVYDGRGGIPLGPLAKWAFSWRFRDATLLLSRDLTPQSRLLFAREVPVRVARVAPFLRLDADPYPVIANGRIVWIQDAYTTTGAYPYAAPTVVRDPRRPDGATARLNYIRNAVKATVDAYDGTVTLYAASSADPILATYRRIFPGLIKPLAQMPEALRAHLRYPEDLFSAQRLILADYHVTDPGVFYARADSWQVARAQRDVESPTPAFVRGPGGGGDGDEMIPYYVIMRLPEERTEEFFLLSPFTPRGRQNMIALLAARCDPGRYGELVLYQFPRSQNVAGPEQIGMLLQGDSRISPQMSLWNQQGSRVLLGNMLVVPVEKSLLYVQPLYLKAANRGQDADSDASAATSIPALKRVIVAYDNRIVMEETLSAALARLFGGSNGGLAPTEAGGAPPTSGPAVPAGSLVEQAGTHYRRAEEALRRGDLEGFARAYKALGAAVRGLEAGERRQ